MTARPLGAPAGPVPEPGALRGPATARGMALLRAGVPLSLLVDLACGPCSAELLVRERPPGPPG